MSDGVKPSGITQLGEWVYYPDRDRIALSGLYVPDDFASPELREYLAGRITGLQAADEKKLLELKSALKNIGMFVEESFATLADPTSIPKIILITALGADMSHPAVKRSSVRIEEPEDMITIRGRASPRRAMAKAAKKPRANPAPATNKEFILLDLAKGLTISVNPIEQRAWVNRQPLPNVTPEEVSVLHALMSKRGAVISLSDLGKEIGQAENGRAAAVVEGLKRRINDAAPEKGDIAIRSVGGVAFMLCGSDQEFIQGMRRSLEKIQARKAAAATP